jgi:hypothetical protein
VPDITPGPTFPNLGSIKFSTRVGQLPLVLAGPVLRAVTDKAVTVWLALKASANVTLRVYQGANPGDPLPLFEASAPTVPLGAQLHVVAVTATGVSLVPGSLYSYNVVVTAGTTTGDLFTGGIVVPGTGTNLPAALEALCYGTFPRPTFFAPPLNIADVRFCHGSCRKAHGESQDALSVLDDIIRTHATTVTARPQQLFLTGDQIYADDMSQILCALAADAAPTLIGTVENIPALGAGGVGGPVSIFGPETRGPIIQASGLSTGNTSNHLVSFGEYAAHYLFNWSDTVWAQQLPTFAQLFPDMTDPNGHDHSAFTTYQAEFIQLVKFRVRLHKVRRALANIPTYTIGDDHDVTDDFLMNRQFLTDVLPSALGRRILMNGMLSTAFFQTWGNTGAVAGGPASFDGRISELITAYASWRGSNFALSGAQLDKVYNLLGLPSGVPDIAQGSDPAAVQIVRASLGDPNTTPLPFSFQLGWTAHELVALSSRLERGYPRIPLQAPALIHDDAIATQIPDNTPGDNRVTIVLSAKPQREHPISTYGQEGQSDKKMAFARDVEGWVDASAFEKLFSALASRGNRNRKVVILAGDVHYGYAFRHQYWSDHPIVDRQQPTSAGAAATFACFTSSAFLKQTTEGQGTVLLHRLGFASLFFRPFDKRQTTRLTWNHTGTTPLTVGHVSIEGTQIKLPPGNHDVPLNAAPGRGVAVIANLSRTVYEAGRRDADETAAVITTPPDAIARSTFVSSTAPPTALPPKLDTVDIPPGGQSQVTNNYLKASVIGIYDKSISPGQEIVGVNNVGIVSFSVDTTTSDVTALQELWWFGRDANDNLVVQPFSAYPVSLKIDPKPVL